MRAFRVTPFWLPVLMLLLPPAVAAASVEDMHQARVEVHGQGEAARAEGFRQALEQVVVRMTGRRAVLADAELQDVLAAPQQFVQSFRYRAIEHEPDEVEADADAGAGEDAEAEAEEAPTHYLDVVFAGERLAQVLEDRDIRLWGARRPEVLVWIAIDDGRDRLLIGEDAGDAVRTRVRETARDRGLPVLFPLLDTEDRRRVDFIDIRGRFYEALRHAGERYRAETMLVGHVAWRAEDVWEADWALIDRTGDIEEWQVGGEAMDDVVDAGVNGVTERIASRMTLREHVRSAFLLRVEQVDSLAAYARVSGYLEDLERTSRVSLVEVSPGSANFHVQFEGTGEDLARRISRDNILAPLAVGGDAVDANGAVADAPAMPVVPAEGEYGPRSEIVFRLVD